MTDHKAQLDQAAADLVSLAAKIDELAVFLRWEGNEVRIIAPSGMYPQITRMLYRAADVCASHCPPVSYDPPPR